MAAQKTWKGFLTFGMLSMPVYLNVAARKKSVELNTFHTECNGPVKMPKTCPTCLDEHGRPGKKLEDGDYYRGFKVGAEKIVQITDEELEAITPETGRQMEISECVRLAEVDLAYFAESYYLLPEDAGKKAYSLLTQTLRDTGRVAIAKLTKHSREHVVAIRPKGNGLMVHYLWYQSEMNENAEFENLEPANLTANELKLAKQLADSLEAEFQPDQYEDGYSQSLTTLISSKLDETIAAPAPVKARELAASQDITAVLMSSLKNKPHRQIRVEDAPAPAKSSKKKGKKAA